MVKAPAVSVPLRGLWFLSIQGSPYKHHVRLCKFPSPCGDYGSYQNIMTMLKKTTYTVSVPLRGLWFLSYYSVDINDDEIADVSVPLRGLWFLSDSQGFTPICVQKKFPSPCGDYGSYRNCIGQYKKQGAVKVSVPLRGLWFLSMRPYSIFTLSSIVSVPLRGLWFLSYCRYGINVSYASMKFPSPCGDYGSYQL